MYSNFVQLILEPLDSKAFCYLSRFTSPYFSIHPQHYINQKQHIGMHFPFEYEHLDNL